MTFSKKTHITHYVLNMYIIMIMRRKNLIKIIDCTIELQRSKFKNKDDSLITETLTERCVWSVLSRSTSGCINTITRKKPLHYFISRRVGNYFTTLLLIGCCDKNQGFSRLCSDSVVPHYSICISFNHICNTLFIYVHKSRTS